MLNKIVVLENGKKYVLVNQAIYKGDSYYTGIVTTEDEEDVTGEFAFLKESKEGEDVYLEPVSDPEILKILLQYMKFPE